VIVGLCAWSLELFAADSGEKLSGAATFELLGDDGTVRIAPPTVLAMPAIDLTDADVGGYEKGGDCEVLATLQREGH
jgi:hypothetical protein